MVPGVGGGHHSTSFWLHPAVSAPTTSFSCPGLTWVYNPLFSLRSILLETLVGDERDREQWLWLEWVQRCREGQTKHENQPRIQGERSRTNFRNPVQ